MVGVARSVRVTQLLHLRSFYQIMYQSPLRSERAKHAGYNGATSRNLGCRLVPIDQEPFTLLNDLISSTIQA